MNSDGQVLINSSIDSSGMEAGAKELIAAMKELTIVMKEFVASFTGSFERASSATAEVARNVDEVTVSMASARNEAESMQAAMDRIPVTGIESIGDQVDAVAANTRELESITESTGNAMMQTYDSEEILRWIDTFEGTSSATNEFKQEITSLENNLKELESRGLYFGDEEYDAAYLKLERIKQALADYKRELTSPTPDALQIDTSTIEGQVQKLKAELQALREASKGFGDAEYDATALSLQRAQEALANYRRELLMTDEQREQSARRQDELNQRLEETRRKEEEAANEAARLQAIGENARISNIYIVRLREEIERLKARQQDLQTAGLGYGYEEYDRNAQRLQQLNARLREYTTRTNRANKSTKQLSSSMKKTNSATAPLTKSILKLSNMLKLMLVRMAMRKVIEMAREGFENLAQYSNDTNIAISSLLSGMTQLKNAFATAFSPVLEYVAPALEVLIGRLAEAVTWVAQLFAALTGKDTFVKAVKVQEDYAESIKDTAKEAKKAIAPFDDLVQLQSTETKTGVAIEDMFVTEEVTNQVQAQADAIKDLFDRLFDPLKNAWDKYGSTVVDSIKNAFGSLKNLVGAVGESFLKAWNDLGYGERITGNSLQAFANLADTVAILANRFREAWEYGGLGDSIMQHLLDIVETLSEKILRATEIIKAWAGTLDFTPILTAFDNLLQAVDPLVNTIGDAVLWLLEYVLLPLASWTIQDAIPAFFNLLAAALRAINEVLLALQPLWQWFWDTVLQPIAAFAGDAFISFLEMLTAGLTKFSQWCSENQGVVQAIAIIIASFFAAWAIVSLVAGIASLVAALVSFVGGIVAAVTAAGGFGAALAALLGPVGIVIAAIGAIIAVIALLAFNWDNIVSAISNKAQSLADTFKNLAARISESWNNIKNDTNSVWGSMPSIITKAMDAIVNTISNIINRIGFEFQLLVSFINDPLETIKKAISGVVTIIEEMAKRIANAIKSIAEAFSSLTGSSGSSGSIGTTTAVSAAATPVTAYSALTYDMPHLATGTVVPPRAGEFAAILGDNNRDYEVVSPVETMKQAFKDAITEMGGLNSNQTVEATMTIDGNRFGRLVAKFGNQENQRIGVRMVTEGV